MYDKDLAREILIQIHEATQKILRRFEPIRSTDDFTDSEAGMEKLDSICMQLIAVGESLKNLDKIDSQEPFIEVSGDRMEKNNGHAGYYQPSLL